MDVILGDSFRPVVHSKASNSYSRAVLKPGTGSSVQVLHLSGRNLATWAVITTLPGCGRVLIWLVQFPVPRLGRQIARWSYRFIFKALKILSAIEPSLMHSELGNEGADLKLLWYLVDFAETAECINARKTWVVSVWRSCSNWPESFVLFREI